MDSIAVHNIIINKLMRKAPCTAALIGTGQTALHGVHRHYYQYYDSSCMSCPVLVFFVMSIATDNSNSKALAVLVFQLNSAKE